MSSKPSEHKYLVRAVPDKFPVHAETSEILQTYLTIPNTRVRRRGQGGRFVYTQTMKRQIASGGRVEIERQISAREYGEALEVADPKYHSIQKNRTCFLWNNHYMELDRFAFPHAGLVLLEVEVDDLTTPVDLPPWIEIEREVTDEEAFSNRALAARTE